MKSLAEIPKPHLRLGCEGEYADASKYDQGGGLPAIPGARLAYDRLGRIEAPEGWTAVACWFTHGTVCLTVRSPSVHLETVLTGPWPGDYFGLQEACIEISPGITPRQCNKRGKPGSKIYIDGVAFTAHYQTYYVFLRK
jgi:hypothetical protein